VIKNMARAILIFVLLFSACELWAENFVEPSVFLQQKLEVFGLAGTPWESESSWDEERSRAWMDALHHAYEKILELPLMEGKQVAHVLQANTALKERLGLVLMTAPKTFFQPDITGMVRCRIDVPFTGKMSLRSALYLAALRPQSMQPVSFLASWTAGVKVDESVPAPEFRRVIIDLRSFGFEPSLFPRFFDASGMLIFQEAMIPERERFSRPAVRFMTDITAARAGLDEEDTFTVAAHVDELYRRDVTVEQADASVFAGFCHDMIKTPLRQREIVIVFDPARPHKKGRLPQTEKKVEKPAGSAGKTEKPAVPNQMKEAKP